MVSPISLEQDVQALWHRFLQQTEPHRPDLYRYCRALTKSVWDAEDLVQDALLRAFARLGDVSAPVNNPKAYLLRTASNLWIDQMRRVRELHSSFEEDSVEHTTDHIDVRVATEHLVSLLSPQERAAVVLKDVFDFELTEIAEILETTVGAIKAALHGGRRKLSASDLKRRERRVDDALIEKFVALFNARDLDGLAALLRADAKGEVVGMGYWQGAHAVRSNPLYYSLFLEHGDSMAQPVEFEGEPIVLLWYSVDDERNRIVRNVLRLETADEQIARLRFFTLCPETLAEIGRSLAVPVATNGYGPWSPEFISLRKQPEYQAWRAELDGSKQRQ